MPSCSAAPMPNNRHTRASLSARVPAALIIVRDMDAALGVTARVIMGFQAPIAQSVSIVDFIVNFTHAHTRVHVLSTKSGRLGTAGLTD